MPKLYLKGKRFNLVKCANCKQIYADTSISREDISQIYDLSGYDLHMIKSEIESDDCKRRLKNIKRCFSKGTKIKILDYGTGMSNFLYIAKKEGFDAYGYDIDPKINRFHRRKRMKMIDLNKVKDKYFDAITLFHVFEHIDTPLEMLDILKSKLKNGGILYIDVPNGESLEIKLFKERSPYVDTSMKAHLYYYSLMTLSRMLRNNGFKIVRKKYKGVFGIGVISSMKKKVTGSEDVGDAYVKRKWLANSYRKLCETFGISDCIEVIARK
jgi:2-polyprenyl-3-methyl-5-hydroxy-6-metoxy-1,4-benzoquinol methylase